MIAVIMELNLSSRITISAAPWATLVPVCVYVCEGNDNSSSHSDTIVTIIIMHVPVIYII